MSMRDSQSGYGTVNQDNATHTEHSAVEVFSIRYAWVIRIYDPDAIYIYLFIQRRIKF